MKRITPTRLAFATLFVLAMVAGVVAPVLAAASPSPMPNSVVINERIFNDCPTSMVTSVNNYPALVSIEDTGMDCFGWANLHNWRFSEDGANSVPFDNNSSYRYSFDLAITGTGNGEAGILIAPWWSQNVDGRFMINATNGEIACFGGRLPFYTFTGAFGLHYAKGDLVHMEAIYEPHGLNSGNPATIEYRLSYLGNDYTSGPLAFDMANPAEDPPHGLWGMLNDGRVGGYFQPQCTPANPTGLKAAFTNIVFGTTPVPTSAVVKERIFNDCPTSTVTSINNYPALISIEDAGMDCFGWANLHNWRFSEDGINPAAFNNDAKFRYSTDLVISGDGRCEAGLNVAPWWSKDVDGRFMVNGVNGEIACFGGRLPFYTFTGAYGISYVKGDPIHMELIYDARGRTAADPATIEYKISYLGADYTSGPIAFDQANPAEDPPYGLYGMLNDGRVGGYFQPQCTPGIPTTAKATFTSIKFTQCLHPADVTFEVKPKDIDLKAKGHKWVDVFIYPAAPLTAYDIDVASLRLNGVPATMNPAPKIEDHGTKLKVKFSRPAFIATLSPGVNVPVYLTGEIAGNCIESVYLLKKVKAPKVHKPKAGDQLIAGTVAEVTWDVDPDAVSVTLMSSFDDGATWNIAADNLSNTGSYMWTVPGVSTAAALLKVVTIYGVDETGFINESEYASSDPFSIFAPTGVGSSSAAFSLRPSNPSVGGLSVSFSLASRAPAALDVFDVSGRKVGSREVGSLGAGPHTVKLGDLPVGIYLVRLSQAGQSLSSRAAVIH
jgi:hypothetical protein